MSSDQKKRQKKLEKQAAKRKEKKHELTRAQSAGLAERLTAATKFPILDCWIPENAQEQGLGWVVLSREFPNRDVAVVNILVDLHCLGVKNVHAEILGRSDYNTKYLRKMVARMKLRKASPADARKLIEDAVAYARGIGLTPHSDYAKAMLLFGDVNAADSKAQFEFGKDGKPFFFAGPNDTPARCRQILAILNNSCGPGGFHYVMPLSGPDFGGLSLAGPHEGEEILDDSEELGENES